jgi:hypothetical protein
MTTNDDDLGVWFDDPEAKLILSLLEGTTRSGRHSRSRRLTPAEERKARQALTNLLRLVQRPPAFGGGLLPKQERQVILIRAACHGLADLLDPDSKDNWKIRFVGGKRLPQDHLAYEIVMSMEKKKRADPSRSLEEIVEEEARQHGYSKRRIWEIWSRAQADRRRTAL